MNPDGLTLIAVAVEEEARPLRRWVSGREQVSVLITGMGRHRAAAAVQSFLASRSPRLVFSCGFAGGLNPDLPAGTILFDADPPLAKAPVWLSAGGRPGRFFCAERVVSTAREKGELWKQSQADGVEMESEAVRRVCAGKGIPSVTVRIILDEAGRDLPLDFNQFLDGNLRWRSGRLAAHLVRHPGTLAELIRFQREVRIAAGRLSRYLEAVMTK